MLLKKNLSTTFIIATFFSITTAFSPFIQIDSVPEEKFEAYKTTIPGTPVAFEMIPVQGGEYLIGSPETEPNRKPDEGPRKKIKIEPFWMGKYEVTWDEFDIFASKILEQEVMAKTKTPSSGKSDAVARPTPPYVDMTFGMGREGFPAINMTHYSAVTYCKWLTAKTGQFYRLPTEAEWEYACKAGTTTAYSFGNDATALGDYAWFYTNSSEGYKKVGSKKANPWGLFDMHGNVSEWTMDQYSDKAYAGIKEGTVNPWTKATQLYPHTVRGGSWDDDADKCRCSARRGSNGKWKKRDPQIPKSNWWMTDASFVGFRIVRPLKQPSPQEMEKYWEEAIKDLGN